MEGVSLLTATDSLTLRRESDDDGDKSSAAACIRSHSPHQSARAQQERALAGCTDARRSDPAASFDGCVSGWRIDPRFCNKPTAAKQPLSGEDRSDAAGIGSAARVDNADRPDVPPPIAPHESVVLPMGSAQMPSREPCPAPSGHAESCQSRIAESHPRGVTPTRPLTTAGACATAQWRIRCRNGGRPLLGLIIAPFVALRCQVICGQHQQRRVPWAQNVSWLARAGLARGVRPATPRFHHASCYPWRRSRCRVELLRRCCCRRSRCCGHYASRQCSHAPTQKVGSSARCRVCPESRARDRLSC